jgi:hypothetical protein
LKPPYPFKPQKPGRPLPLPQRPSLDIH